MSSPARLTAESEPAGRSSAPPAILPLARLFRCSLLLLPLLPALAAVWIVPGFVTQDGPAHLYNAHIIEQSFHARSPFRDVYRVRWQPFPNWAGHLALVGLLKAVPPRVADLLMTSLTMVGFAAAILWQRFRVAGTRGLGMAAVLAALLSLNIAWLLGFTSFLLGACLFPLVLGIWWDGRERLGAGRMIALAVLTIVGYFSHLVSLGLTCAAIGLLALMAPGGDRRNRAARTALALLPVVPLAAVYLYLAREGGPMYPTWENLKNPASLRSWYHQLVWVDPITLSRKVVLPFLDGSSVAFGLITPVVLLAFALALYGAATLVANRHPERRVWGIVGALFMLGGMASPDTLGSSHGNYLSQRVVLLGLVALMPFLDLEFKGRVRRVAGTALLLALMIQTAFVWEYALASHRTAGALAEALPAVGRAKRVATLMSQIRIGFRANPLLHSDNLLGVGTGNVVWGNYETQFYYFPVQFLPEIERLDVGSLEWVALDDDPKDAKKRADGWRSLLERYHQTIDVLVVWGKDPQLDAISDAWFEPIYEKDNVRILRLRKAAAGDQADD